MPKEPTPTPAQITPLPDAFRTIFKRIPGWQPDVIFDVGANIGQSALEYAQACPKARIHSFEPVPRTHARLVAATRHLPNVTPHACALGRSNGAVVMTDLPTSVLNHVVETPNENPRTTDPLVQGIQMRRGDDLCAELQVGRISFLKIDTEGHDLEVLHGFGDHLAKVDFLQVEAGMNPYNKTHVPFDQLTQFLTAQGFLLFYIFAQKLEFKNGGRPVLRRANPVFINGGLLDLDGIF